MQERIRRNSYCGVHTAAFILRRSYCGVRTAELLRTTLDGTILEHVTTLGPQASASVAVQLDNGVAFLHAPFAPRPLTHVAPDGRAIALLETDIDNATWSLTVLDAHGDTLFVRDVSFRGEPIPGDSMDPAIERQLARVPTPVQRLAARRDLEPLLPPFFAPVQQLVVDDLGRTWVGLRHLQDVRPWLVFSAGGRPLGVLGLPAAGRVLAAGAEPVYVVEPDEFDVQSVVRYRASMPR